MQFAQLTDLHVGSATDGALHNGVDPLASLVAAVNRVNDFTPPPDVVVVTGDLVDEGSAAEYAIVRGALDRLDMPYLVIPGNHDERGAMRTAFSDHPEIASADEDFLQWVVDDQAVRLVGLDTVIAGRTEGELCARRLDWLRETLAAEPEQPTVVAMHHPPFDTGLWWMDRYGMIAGATQFRSIIEANPQVVRVLCGHQHRNVSINWGPTMLSICPSTWFQQHLSLEPESPPAGVAEPGAYQMHLWTGSSLVTHTDYVLPQAEPVEYTKTWMKDWDAVRVRLRESGARGA